MTEYKGISAVIFLIILSHSNVFADKIYLKSGETVEGKIIDRTESYNPAQDYCQDFNDLVVVCDNNSCQCVPRDGILHVEKKFKKPEGLALLAKDDKWGIPHDGYATQLIPQSEQYLIGKPMKFGLVLKNISDSVKLYDRQYIAFNSLLIKTSDTNEQYYKHPPFQTQGAGEPIDKGEIVTLFENRNITDEYVIIKPGRYTIQFRGAYYGHGSNFPASNVIEFEVKPGTPKEEDILISSLVGILPEAKWRDKWQLASIPNENMVAPAGRKEVKGVSIALIRLSGVISTTIIAQLWQTKTSAEISEQKAGIQISDYLGRNASGYFYAAIPPKALECWPKMKDDISNALNLVKHNQ